MLGVFNIRQDLWNGLTRTRELVAVDDSFQDVSGLFMDWVPKSNPDFPKQAVIIEHYVKVGIPIIIYDRFLSIEKKEFNWLKKFNVSFWEPAVCNRTGFEYVPQWTTWTKGDEYIDREDREIDLAYDGILDGKIASFEKYYKEYAGLFPNKNVVYSADLNTIKIHEYENYNLKKVSGINAGDVSFTILIGSTKEYSIGYLRDDMFDLMKKGVLPLLPLEHRFFGTVFKDFIIAGENDLDYFISHFKKIKGVLIEEIFTRFLIAFPEIQISYVIEKIKDYV